MMDQRSFSRTEKTMKGVELIKRIRDSRIESADKGKDQGTIGLVQKIGDGIAIIVGLSGVRLGEIVRFRGTGVEGLTIDISEEGVGVVLLGLEGEIKEGSEVERTERVMEVNVGEELEGRVLNGLGEIIDGGRKIAVLERRRIEVKAPGIIQREGITEMVETGVKAIDSLVPIGRGQRELIIGDRMIGKTAIILDTIINQRMTKGQEGSEGMSVVYVGVGQKRSTMARVVSILKEYKALENSIIVIATASESAALQYIAPFVGCTIGEYYRDNGKHAIIFYDDLTKQAIAYRQVSLLLRRAPGREAYPGDVFYLHSRLLERAAKMSKIYGGGSLTAIPVIETQGSDVSAYIPTNIISITDGQIFLESGLFHEGIRPGINVGLSVSRVGSAAQIKAMKKYSGTLKTELAQYREIEAFEKFGGGSDLDKTTLLQLEKGARIVELLKQAQYEPLAIEKQVILLSLSAVGYFITIKKEDVKEYAERIVEYMEYNKKDLLNEIRRTGEFSGEALESLVKDLKKV